MLRCKPGEAWGVRGRSSQRLAERCDGAVDQCRDGGESVVARRVLSPAGHQVNVCRQVARRIWADRLVSACVDWQTASRVAPLRCRADQKPHRMRPLDRTHAEHLNPGAAEYPNRCVDGAGTTRWLLEGHKGHASPHGPRLRHYA